MAKTSVRLEGGREGAPDTIALENDRLSAMLRRAGGTHQLASLRAGGEYELLAEPSPLLSCYDGKEHLPVPFEEVALEQNGSGVARLRFAAQREGLQIGLVLSLAPGRPCLEIEATCQSAQDWQGLLYLSCVAQNGFVPVAYPAAVLLPRGASCSSSSSSSAVGQPDRGRGWVRRRGRRLHSER